VPARRYGFWRQHRQRRSGVRRHFWRLVDDAATETIPMRARRVSDAEHNDNDHQPAFRGPEICGVATEDSAETDLTPRSGDR
jgi:hypothetical protein